MIIPTTQEVRETWRITPPEVQKVKNTLQAIGGEPLDIVQAIRTHGSKDLLDKKRGGLILTFPSEEGYAIRVRFFLARKGLFEDELKMGYPDADFTTIEDKSLRVPTASMTITRQDYITSGPGAGRIPSRIFFMTPSGFQSVEFNVKKGVAIPTHQTVITMDPIHATNVKITKPVVLEINGGKMQRVA